jgi:hypothetical protein
MIKPIKDFSTLNDNTHVLLFINSGSSMYASVAVYAREQKCFWSCDNEDLCWGFDEIADCFILSGIKSLLCLSS